jgi:murein DD-endopeptidase MepM/ murein hydrolase activator NlpD
LFRPAPARELNHRNPSLRERVAGLELVTDLGSNIGSREWLRGFAICAGLCYAAWSFAPEYGPLAAAAPPAMADAQWEEARSLSISPLAYGADTGRRMAATEAVQPLTDTPERPTIELLATLGRGDSFARVLTRNGVARPEAEQVAALVGGAMSLDQVSPGTVVDLRLGRRPNRQVARPLDFLSFRAAFDLKLEVQRLNGALALTRIPIAVDNTPLRIQGRVGSSLYRSARAAGAPAKAVEAYLRAIATQTSIANIGADDRFDIIIEHRKAATGESESGKLLYAGLDRARGKSLQLMQWTMGGSSQWFEASGVGQSSGALQRPVPGMVTSNFGRRMHPILGYSRMHKGMDFRAGYGTPILAATDGRVTRAGWAGGYGKQVRINHAEGLSSSYSHMSRIVAQPGQRVRRGQLIGYVGSTGLSTGPHLHYELYKNGQAVNPATFKFSSRAQLAGGELAGFKAKLRRLLSLPTGGGTQTSTTAQADLPAKPAGI